MDTSEHGRFRISISLDAHCYAFVERLIAAGVVESRDQVIATALHALSREIDAIARATAVDQGWANAEDASLEELVDMLDETERGETTRRDIATASRRCSGRIRTPSEQTAAPRTAASPQKSTQPCSDKRKAISKVAIAAKH